jgi:hypothetical protein
MPVVINGGAAVPAPTVTAVAAAPVSGASNSAAGGGWERWKTRFETVKGGLVVVATAVGLVVGLRYGLPIIKAQHAKAELDEQIAKADIATREAAAKQILDLELSAQVLGTTAYERYVLITLDVKNTGNRDLSIPANHLTASITNVNEIETGGKIHYGDTYAFEFGPYPDARVNEMRLSPGERRKLQSVQTLRNEGLNLVTAAIKLGERANGDDVFRANLFTHLH